MTQTHTHTTKRKLNLAALSTQTILMSRIYSMVLCNNTHQNQIINSNFLAKIINSIRIAHKIKYKYPLSQLSNQETTKKTITKTANEMT